MPAAVLPAPELPCAVCAPALLWLPELEALPLLLSRAEPGDDAEGTELSRLPLLEALAVELEDDALEDEDELDEEALGTDDERDDDEEEDELDTLGLDDELELDELELEEDELEDVDGMELCDDCCCDVDSQAASASDAALMTSNFLIGDFFMALTSRPADTFGSASFRWGRPHTQTT